MGYFWSEDLVDENFIEKFRKVIVDPNRNNERELKDGDVFFNVGKVNFSGVEKGNILNRFGKVKEFKSLCRGGRFVFVKSNYGVDKSKRIISLFDRLWKKEEKVIRRLLDGVLKELDRGKLRGFDNEMDSRIHSDVERNEKLRDFYIDGLMRLDDKKVKRIKWIDQFKREGRKYFTYSVNKWSVGKGVKVFSKRELINIFGDLRVSHWSNEYKNYDEENSFWYVGSDWNMRGDGRFIRINNFIKKDNKSIWKVRKREKKLREEQERLEDEKVEKLGFYKRYLYFNYDLEKIMEGETYLQGVRRRKKEVESEIGKMKEEDKKTQKDNLKSLVKDFMNFRKDKMEEKEVDEFINNKRFKDGETLFSETKRFQRLKEIKTILGKWSKNIDKEGLGFIISIRSRLKKKGMMTNGQYKWFIYKLGGVSTLDNIKLKEKWKCIDESQKTYFKDDLRRIFVRYGLEWNELEGLDSENLNRVSLDKVLSDDDYRERIGKGKLKGF